MSHTEGSLSLFNKRGTTAILDANGREVVGWMGFDMSERSKREHKANARRLVACWNACSTIPTDVLENGTVAGVTPFYLIKERDELLKAFLDLYTEVMVEFAYCPDPVKFESILDKYEGTDHAK